MDYAKGSYHIISGDQVHNLLYSNSTDKYYNSNLDLWYRLTIALLVGCLIRCRKVGAKSGLTFACHEPFQPDIISNAPCFSTTDCWNHNSLSEFVAWYTYKIKVCIRLILSSALSTVCRIECRMWVCNALGSWRLQLQVRSVLWWEKVHSMVLGLIRAIGLLHIAKVCQHRLVLTRSESVTISTPLLYSTQNILVSSWGK